MAATYRDRIYVHLTHDEVHGIVEPVVIQQELYHEKHHTKDRRGDFESPEARRMNRFRAGVAEFAAGEATGVGWTGNIIPGGYDLLDGNEVRHTIRPGGDLMTYCCPDPEKKDGKIDFPDALMILVQGTKDDLYNWVLIGCLPVWKTWEIGLLGYWLNEPAYLTVPCLLDPIRKHYPDAKNIE